MASRRGTRMWMNRPMMVAGCFAWCLASCNSPQPRIVPFGNPGAGPVQDRVRASSGTSKALLYVSGGVANGVSIYSYPGLDFQKNLTGIVNPQGLCANRSTGAVWVVSGPPANAVIQFAHGQTKPMRTLKVDAHAYIQGCAVDAATGDVAVGVSFPAVMGYLAIFKRGKEPAIKYSVPGMFAYYFPAYDRRGNAYVDGFVPKQFAELPNGSTQLVIVKIKGARLPYPGSMQYDGSYITIQNQQSGTIYEIAGDQRVGVARFSGICFTQQSYIDATLVAIANACGSNNEVDLYRYPYGGLPLKTLNHLSGAFGVVVSG